ncbi:MAG: hypothetical protein IJF20_05680 [Clostridia bacterium]|nr:hypothetical protein [Clostridia bacterium]
MKNYTLAVLKADKNDISGSFAKAIAFLEKNEKNILNAFYASDYKFIKKNEPETFERVKALVENGRLQPLAGWWNDSTDEKISDENMARNTLYSQKFFMKNFGKVFRTAYGKKLTNPSAIEILFRSRINCYVEEDADAKADYYWLDSKNLNRILGTSTKVLNFKSIDEVTDEDTTITLDEYFHMFYNNLDDVDAIADVDFSDSLPESETEKLLLQCEVLDVVNVVRNGAESKIKEINKAWKALLSGFPCAKEKAEAIAKELEGVQVSPTDIFETTSETAELVAFRKCCKNSDKIILRIRQTKPVSEKIIVKSKLLDACFWVDIEPYEIRSFIIDADGIAVESNIIENIDI